MCIFISILQMKQVNHNEAKWFNITQLVTELELTLMSFNSKYSSISYHDASFNLYLQNDYS